MAGEGRLGASGQRFLRTEPGLVSLSLIHILKRLYAKLDVHSKQELVDKVEMVDL